MPDAPLKQVEFMKRDTSVECGTEEHDSIRLLAGFLIGVWPLGSLLLFSSLLIPCGRSIRTRSPSALALATAFLHREYKPKWYWWEVFELARKLVLTGALLLIPEKRAFLRIVVATLICAVDVALTAAARPYKRIEDGVLAVVRANPPLPKRTLRKR